ncbi:MAG: nicotinate phosphoribosyltransferase [Acidimicrobiia bacterium]|nr:MAG: nicotinate phosphoribosyltransferase [Acidimicrobiia bacterium]
MPEDRRDLTEGFLFTDQYQLTMAQLYWKHGLAERTAQFDYFFRRYPDYGEHQAGYVITAGLGWLLEWIDRTRIGSEDLEVLRGQVGPGGRRRFDDGFLAWLEGAEGFGSLTVRAVPEGRVVHAAAPLGVVEGPLALAQIIETSLLNHLNYQTLIATKASRVVEQARGGAVLEFGMRRGPDVGTNAGTRAALIGGVDGSSNVGISHVLGSSPAGTHGHSMVQLFMALGGGELAAFRAYADVYPDECVFLVDTIDTLGSGIPNAITVFEELRHKGHEPVGIRLDSGDLAHLAVRSARMLTDAGFDDAAIVLSSDLDELAMWQIRAQINEEASVYGLDPGEVTRRLMFGVGTRLISSDGYPALGGVYKLVSIDDGGSWRPAMKISDTPEKMPIPGDKRLWRVYDERGLATADVVSAGSETLNPGETLRVHHPHQARVTRELGPSDTSEIEQLLETVYADGSRLDGSPDLAELRRRRLADLDRLDVGVRRLINPHRYHVSVTEAVKDLQGRLIAQARS